jgi:hypothetical protein
MGLKVVRVGRSEIATNPTAASRLLPAGLRWRYSTFRKGLTTMRAR